MKFSREDRKRMEPEHLVAIATHKELSIVGVIRLTKEEKERIAQSGLDNIRAYNLTQSLPNDPDQVIVFSIDGPSIKLVDCKPTVRQAKRKMVYCFPIIGKTEVPIRKQRRRVIAALKEATENPDPHSNGFVPQHLVRIIGGNDTVDLLISFPSGRYEAYSVRKNPERIGRGRISHRPKKLLDRILTDAGIPLAPEV